MSNVAQLKQRTRRLDNPHSQLGRVYLALREADTWLQLHQIADEILERFGQQDSHAAVSARIRELRGYGQAVASREAPGPGGTRPHEYWMPAGGGQGGAA